MEPAELLIGILGLAGLLGACMDALNSVRSYLSFEADSCVIDARFASPKPSFELWKKNPCADSGPRSRPSHQSPDDRQATLAHRIVPLVQSLCGMSGTDTGTDRPLESLRLANTAGTSTEGAGRKLAWAFCGSRWPHLKTASHWAAR